LIVSGSKFQVPSLPEILIFDIEYWLLNIFKVRHPFSRLQFYYSGTKEDKMMKTLFTEDDYREALKRFLEISEAPEDTEEADELEKLMYLLEEYEKENCS
jgi:hypothetical protein